MIIYEKQAFGLNLLFRVHGSAVYRSIVPGCLSICCLLLLRYLFGVQDLGYGRDPDMIGVLIASTTFLIVFRANHAYSRYWEAAGAVHHMMGKWMDATIHSGVFHMQCDHYDHIKPPSYYNHHELNQYYLTRARERNIPPSSSRYKDSNSSLGSHIKSNSTDAVGCAGGHASLDSSINTKRRQMMKRASVKSINQIDTAASSFGKKSSIKNNTNKSNIRLDDNFTYDESQSGRDDIARRLLGDAKLDGNWSALFDDGKSTYFNPYGRNSMSVGCISHRRPASAVFVAEGGGHQSQQPQKLPSFASHDGGRTPSLFLQELAHLSSLLCAVALSTLRNDIDGAQSPLGVYTPGSPWPEVDSDQIDGFGTTVGGAWHKRCWTRCLYLLGAGKTPEERTRYNAARPMPVIGGVSDNEIAFLQMARGPYGKTMLVWDWLSEFIIREHLAGSMGKVGPPIISFLFQFMSDGMVHYNHARKIMFTPFPFPHAQLSSLFIFISIPVIAFMMDQFVENTIIACVLSFLSVLCLSGIHEVARELENPFRNIPNELPLVTFQAQFNEALITMYSGYHPDHFWNADDYKTKNYNTDRKMQDIYGMSSGECSSKSDNDDGNNEAEEEKREINSTTTTITTDVEDQRKKLEFLESKMDEYVKEITKLKQAMQASSKTKKEDNTEIAYTNSY